MVMRLTQQTTPPIMYYIEHIETGKCSCLVQRSSTTPPDQKGDGSVRALEPHNYTRKMVRCVRACNREPAAELTQMERLQKQE